MVVIWPKGDENYTHRQVGGDHLNYKTWGGPYMIEIFKMADCLKWNRWRTKPLCVSVCVCVCVATGSHACFNSGWQANIDVLHFVSVHRKELCVCVCLCVCVWSSTAATKCSMCWGSSPFDKLFPGFSCSPASPCWTQCEGTGPLASPQSPRSPAKHTHTQLWENYVHVSNRILSDTYWYYS